MGIFTQEKLESMEAPIGQRPPISDIFRVNFMATRPTRFEPETSRCARTKFWEALHSAMGTTLLFSTAYHPQTRGQTERVKQILEDMLRSCAIMYSSNWDVCLPFAEFAYNNSHQVSINIYVPL